MKPIKNFITTYALYILCAVIVMMALVIVIDKYRIGSLEDDLVTVNVNYGISKANATTCHMQVAQLNAQLLAIEVNAESIDKRRAKAEKVAAKVVADSNVKILLIKQEHTETVEQLRLKMIHHATF